MADKPASPKRGKPDDAAVETDAAKTKATSQKKADETAADAPKPAKKKRTSKKPKAEGTAAKKTGVDKAAAEALADVDSDPKATAKDTAKGKRKPAAKKPAAKKPAAKKPAAKKPAAKKPAAKTPAAKTPAAKTPAAKTPAAKTPAAKPPAAKTPAAKPAARRRDRRESGAEAVVVRAHAKYVRSSARKARLVCNQIRGKSVPEARALLAFSPRDVAEAWNKLLDSAVANAEHNHELIGDDLKVLAVFADEGPTIKRFRPRAMGRATSIRKRTSHLTIQLTPKEL